MTVNHRPVCGAAYPSGKTLPLRAMPMASNSPFGNRSLFQVPCASANHTAARLMDLCFRDDSKTTAVDAGCLHRPLQIFVAVRLCVPRIPSTALTSRVAQARLVSLRHRRACDRDRAPTAERPGRDGRGRRTPGAAAYRAAQGRSVCRSHRGDQRPARQRVRAPCSSLTGCHTPWQQPWQSAVDPDDLLEVLERETDADVELIALSGEPITRTTADVERSWSGHSPTGRHRGRHRRDPNALPTTDQRTPHARRRAIARPRRSVSHCYVRGPCLTWSASADTPQSRTARHNAVPA